MECAKVADHVAAYLDGVLDAGSRDELHQHLQRCARCEVYAVRFAHVLLAVDAIGPDDICSRLLGRPAMAPGIACPILATG